MIFQGGGVRTPCSPSGSAHALAQQRKRLVFARTQDWAKYVFSDESTKYLFHVLNRQVDTVWGSQSENGKTVDSTCHIKLYLRNGLGQL